MVTKVMGFSLFIVGLLLIILSILSLLEIIQFGVGERLLMFVGGLILVVLAYFMARDRREEVE